MIERLSQSEVFKEISSFSKQELSKTNRFEVFEPSLHKWLIVHTSILDNSEIHLLMNDITPRKQKERMDEQKLIIMERVGSLVQVGGFELELDTQQLFWSEELFKIHEYESDTISVTEAIRFYTPESKKRIEQHFTACIEDTIPYDLELDIITAKGNLKKVRTYGEPVLVNGKVTKVTGALIDITTYVNHREELTRLNEDLNRSNQDLVSFAYVASHDLQEPVRHIVSFTEILGKNLEGKLDAKNQEYFDFIKNSAERIQNMILDLLRFSRVNTRSFPLHTVDSSEVLGNVLSQLKEKSDMANVEFHISELPIIHYNSSLLESVLNNLIENAIKYTDKSLPIIEVGCEELTREFQFFVKDNGPGISPEYYDLVFNIFKRLDQSKPGSGIGLAISKRIVERFNGKIWIAPKEGGGTIFYFTIPKVGETPKNVD